MPQGNCLAFISEYAYRANAIVVIPHYHVAINNPFPASVEDCYEGLKWTIDFADKLDIDLERIALAGESAGGALTATLSQLVRDRDLMKPIFQMLIYPVTSSKLDSGSMVDMPDAPVWGAINARISWEKYLAGYDEVPKYASPLDTEDFSGLPPAYIEPAEFDVLRDEGIAYAKKLEATGIPTELNITKGTIHAFDLNKESTITKAAMDSLSIQPGKADTLAKYFESVAQKAKEAEKGTLIYTWSFNESKTEAKVIEQYADANAYVAHVQNVDIAEVAKIASFKKITLCGNPPNEILEGMKAMGAEIYAPFAGLKQ